MKKSVLLSLSLLFAINAITVNTTQAIEWKKVAWKKCAKVAVGMVGFLTCFAAVCYALEKSGYYENQNGPITHPLSDEWIAIGAGATASNALLRNQFDLPHASMHSPFATF